MMIETEEKGYLSTDVPIMVNGPSSTDTRPDPGLISWSGSQVYGSTPHARACG
jgi:hypothetical protein